MEARTAVPVGEMSGTGAYLLRGVLAWLPMPVIAVANAALREFVLQPVFGPVSQPLSGLTLMALLAAYTFLMFRRVIGDAPPWAAWLLGAIWAALTLGFEYALIAQSRTAPLDGLLETLSPSAIADGNLFVLAVLLLLIAPRLFTRSAASAT